VGNIDKIDREQIGGWAWDKNQPDTPIKVDIYDGDKLIGTATADVFRKDLQDEGMGNGKHGFSYPTPDSLKDGKPHTVRVKTSGTNIEIGGSPKVVTLR
jgi:hypothetical protein